jgi:putative ABC transport system permease protein
VTVHIGPALVAVLGVLTLFAAAVTRLGGIGSGRPTVVAAVRAAAQLAVVSLLIAAVLRSWWWTAAFIAVMAGVAAVTSAGRVVGPRAVPWTAGAIAAGVTPVLTLLLVSGLVPLVPVAVLPIAGILIGNTMTATSLAGRRALDELANRHGEYEAALALGFLPRDAALEIARPSAGQALVPAMDQTRTVGLVTLPGAFVGVLLGGASPAQAGVTQLIVLIGLLAVQAVAVLVTVELVAAGAIRRPARADVRRRSRPSRRQSPAATGR